jgi:hypothetical protein
MNNRPPTGREVAEQIIHLLYEFIHRGDPDTARRDLVGATLGVTTALKLLVRLETHGTIVLTAAPEAIDAIEELSDHLAGELFDSLAGEVHGAGMLSARLAMSRFTRTEHTLTFRFAPPLGAGEVAPDDFQDAMMLSCLAGVFVDGMMKLFEGAMGTLDGRDVVIGKIAFLIGFTALAKVMMAYWGCGSLASAIDGLADQDSESRYREMFTPASNN